MERSKMHIKTSLILLSLLIFVGCENSMTKSDEMSDDQLMQDIIDAEKIDINMTDLPSLSRTVIDQDYNDYIEIDAKMASGLGYQVSMDGKGYKPGDHNEVYFNLEGRKLKSKRDRGDKDGFKCFELLLPVTFIMPDGIYIVVEDENGYVEKFVHKVVKDYDAAIIGLKAGELDVIGLPMEKFMNQTNSKKITNNYTKELYNIPGYGYIGWNQKNPLFKSKMVRRAMTHLLDRKQIIETLFYNEAEICKSPIYFKREEFNNDIVPWPYDPKIAKQILAEEGWKDTDGDGILDKIINGKKEKFKFTVLSNNGNEVRKQIGLILAESFSSFACRIPNLSS